jgi:hypothetical protein
MTEVHAGNAVALRAVAKRTAREEQTLTVTCVTGAVLVLGE